jgi:hypothetical protein
MVEPDDTARALGSIVAGIVLTRRCSCTRGYRTLLQRAIMRPLARALLIDSTARCVHERMRAALTLNYRGHAAALTDYRAAQWAQFTSNT